MALPYDGEPEFGRRGGYELTERSEAVTPISKPSVTTYEFNQPNNEGEPPQGWTKFIPECLNGIPSVFLILLAILIVLFVVCSIPLVFVLTQSPQQQISPIDDRNDVWPGGDDPEFRFENSSIPLLAGLLPKNVTQCRGMGFVCVSRPDIKIGSNSRCDGVADCPDGSDEAFCRVCQTSFSCPQSSNSSSSSPLSCLRAKALCDGLNHCSDRSDELFCEGKCSSDKFKCPSSSMCIPKNFLCDGENHCPGGEDENKCEEKCQNGSKYCKSLNKCLPKWMLCNGIKDCEDGSDEDDCDCMQCSAQRSMLCKSSSNEKGFCFNGERVCNGIRDCPNGEDEDGCPGELKMNENEMVKCNDGKTYSKVYACLGLISSCQGVCDECNKNSAFDCGNKHCILKSKVCDGINDCPNGLDEMNCTCATTSFKCPSLLPSGNEKCIEQSQRCDGFIDCPGGEDEKGCDKCSNNDVFKCKKENKCIAQTARCDGREQCSDGSDEADCSAEECAIHPVSMYLCSDGRSCFRKDEVCNPYSKCPKSSGVDKGYCAVFRKSSFMI